MYNCDGPDSVSFDNIDVIVVGYKYMSDPSFMLCMGSDTSFECAANRLLDLW